MTVFLVVQRKPALDELDLLQGKCKMVRVIDRIAPMWKRVATRLHSESHDIIRIHKDHYKDSREACLQVMMEWLSGKGRQPITWETLMKAFDEAELSEVNKDLKVILAEH